MAANPRPDIHALSNDEIAPEAAAINAAGSAAQIGDTDGPLPDQLEPVEPAEAARGQAMNLAPPADRLWLIVGGVGAAAVGGLVGFWLASRRDRRPARKMRKAASAVEHAIDLAPVAFQLAANPLVRGLALRMLTRQVGRRLAA
ncbi:MAG: hypothetical protein AB7K36_10215 [Chloroflexota bacterium]